MLRFSANLSTLFQQLPFRERFAAAAEAGFKAVETWFPYEIPAGELSAILRDNGLACVGINSPAGDVANGDWGLALDTSRRPQFEQSVDTAMRYAEAIDCPNVHVMAGNRVAGVSEEQSMADYSASIALACDIARRHGRQVMVEALNVIDRPAYFLNRQDQALALIESLQVDNLGVMLDLFHVQRGEGNLVERMRKSLPHARHIQIADAPARHEPGTGEINFGFVFAELERLGYQGWIGCEYLPAGDTVAGLGWMHAVTSQR
ncbi:MAG: hydroxypyruvate isomerase [Comamonadaceae bacterium]|nr:MAG: hydroxypyruvate isomerase [Comamonadaceae bacterium]